MRVKNGRWLMVGMIFWLIIVVWCASWAVVGVVYGADESKEMLTVKRDLLAERAVRIQTQMQLLQQQFAVLQVDLDNTRRALDNAQKELDSKFPPEKKEKK